MSQCCAWQSKRKTTHTSQYFETQIQRSLDKHPLTQRSISSSRSQFSLLNKSLDDTASKIAGVSHFYQKQQRAKEMKEKREFLLQNPTSHTWNFKRRLNSSLDGLVGQYLDFGESVYSRRGDK